MYKLWYPYLKFSTFLISRDMTFNESIMLSPRNEQLYVGNNPSVRKKMKFVPKASKTI